MIRKLAAAGGAALLAAAVAAQTAAPPAGPGGNDPAKRICRVTHDTGSRLNRRRVCMSEAEWAAQQLQMKHMIDRAQTKQTNPGSGYGGVCCA